MQYIRIELQIGSNSLNLFVNVTWEEQQERVILILAQPLNENTK